MQNDLMPAGHSEERAIRRKGHRMHDESVPAEGRDLLKHMAERTKTAIQKTARRLENLKSVNEAAEEYVKERYDMDISAFRGS